MNTGFSYVLITGNRQKEYIKKARYGIACLKDNIVVDLRTDISDDLQFICAEIEKMNRHRLLPIHFREYVDDLIRSADPNQS